MASSLLVMLMVATLVATGCGPNDDDSTEASDGPGTERVGSPDITTSGSTTSGNYRPGQQGSGEHGSGWAGVALRRVEVDLDAPIAAIALPTKPVDVNDDDHSRGAGERNRKVERTNDVGAANGLVVAERRGIVRVVTFDGDKAVLSSPVIDISDDVSTEMEQGLLGLALNPSLTRLILSYTNSDGDTRVDSYPIRWNSDNTGETPPFVAERRASTELLAVDQPFPNHNGGHIEFGPDGMLYVGLGDGGAGGDPSGNAQNRSTLLGKLLRLDADASDKAERTPKDNPFVATRDARGEIWATGLRNPWRFSFDPQGQALWIGDVGQDRFEEVNLVTESDGYGRGANFGWDLFEGNQKFDQPDPAPSPASDGPFIAPLYTYEHGPRCSITGGVVYRGTAITALVGAYLYSDFCDGTIRTLVVSSDSAARSQSLQVSVDQPVAFANDTRGEVYVLSLTDGIFRITPR